MTGEASRDKGTRPCFEPIVARTRTVYGPSGPNAYDCIRVITIRDGTGMLFSEFGEQPIRTGDVVLISANVLCGSEPEGHVTATTIYADPDYVLDQVRWQYASLVPDRHAAQDFANTIYTEPAQVLRLGEDRAGMLMPWLDELVSLSVDGHFIQHFFRIQALWFSIAHLIAPFITISPIRMTPSQHAHVRPVLPRTRRFAPLRSEARQVADMLRGAPTEHWTLELLAKRVHLSRSQVSRVFADAYGKTPLAFLTMLRAEQLAKLLRETDIPVEVAMKQVGWFSRGHAARTFQQYVGVTPYRYRQISARRPRPT